MTRMENSQTWPQAHIAHLFTSILGIVVGLLTALAANLMLR
ncbi:MAG TPA: hypothetical protein VMS96_14425 [Terriglobales bacterium]|nr:hypothetical protein [Terriglobales bacterium]